MGEEMPKVDMSKVFNKLNASDQHYIKRIEQLNNSRSQSQQTMRFRNRLTGTALGLLALGIYTYTIFAVRQETFLDDIEVPAPQKKEEK